jgi:subtilisin-like proprotein convertase family protein
LAAAVAIDTRLRGLPGQEAAADQLLAAFWLRRARGAAHAEQRDAAALFALRAAELPSAEQATAAAYFRELVGNDYPYLERSLRLADAPAVWHMLFADSTVLALDAEHRMLRLPFGAAAGGDALGTAPLHLTALQHVALTRELDVEGEGTAGDLELTLVLQHPAGGELLVTLTAPSGAQAVVAVPSSAGATVETFVFPAARGSPLALLADEGRAGVWRLTIVDRRADNAGVLAGWELRFEGDSWRDAPAEPLAIPEPTRTEAVTVTVDGAHAVVWPEMPGAVGTLALWNLATQKLENDFTLPAVPRHVALNATGDRLVTATDNVVTLWNAADGMPVARLTTETEFVLPPVFSPDGGYVAIAERVADAQPLYSVLRAADASLVGSIEGFRRA